MNAMKITMLIIVVPGAGRGRISWQIGIFLHQQKIITKVVPNETFVQ